MEEDGRLVLPAALRREGGLRPGDTVVIESDGDSLLLKSYDRALAEIQGHFAAPAAPAGLLSEERVRERRAEADREQRG